MAGDCIAGKWIIENPRRRVRGGWPREGGGAPGEFGTSFDCVFHFPPDDLTRVSSTGFEASFSGAPGKMVHSPRIRENPKPPFRGEVFPAYSFVSGLLSFYLRSHQRIPPGPFFMTGGARRKSSLHGP